MTLRSKASTLQPGSWAWPPVRVSNRTRDHQNHPILLPGSPTRFTEGSLPGCPSDYECSCGGSALAADSKKAPSPSLAAIFLARAAFSGPLVLRWAPSAFQDRSRASPLVYLNCKGAQERRSGVSLEKQAVGLEPQLVGR